MNETVSDAVEKANAIALGTALEMKNMFHLDELSTYLTWANLAKLITSIVAIFIFWIVYRVLRKLVKNSTQNRFQEKTSALITKAISYCFYVIIAMYILGLFGIDLSAVWGAAGIAGVAIGFAAQTSVSNLISGIFVLTEKTMKIGDFIEVDGIMGTVDSVGLLSVKIHTVDNQLVRIPSSLILNTQLKNYSSFEYRRFSFPLLVSYTADLEKALEIIMQVPNYCSTVIKDKEELKPSAICTGMEDSGFGVTLNVWFERQNFIQTRNDVWINFMKLCDQNNIDIPYTHYDINILPTAKDSL